jgi:hypothetical protein
MAHQKQRLASVLVLRPRRGGSRSVSSYATIGSMRRVVSIVAVAFLGLLLLGVVVFEVRHQRGNRRAAEIIETFEVVPLCRVAVHPRPPLFRLSAEIEADAIVTD